jgi:hypothetical protein
MRYRIEIVTDEPQARVDLLHRNIRKYGTITNTLAAACELTGEMVARRARDSSTGQADVDPTPVHAI